MPEETINKDSWYFLESLHLKVEDTQFCVPKVGLNRPGTIFADMFTLPPGCENEASTEGSTERNPIILPVSKAAFQSFIRVLYPLPGCGGPGLPTEVDDWINALDLATMWRFIEVRKTAIDAIINFDPPLSPLRLLTLGKRYYIPDLVKKGYIALLTQDGLLDHSELLQSGIDSTSIIYLSSIREKILAAQIGALTYAVEHGGRHGVFCCSTCNVFSESWRESMHTGRRLCLACAERESPTSYQALSALMAPDLISETFRKEWVELEREEAQLAHIDDSS